MRRVVVVAERTSVTNRALVAAFRAFGMVAVQLGGQQLRAARVFGRLDDAVLLGRADVSRRLDGVGEAFWELRRLEHASAQARVLNGSRTLLRCHDKLQTARRLRQAGLPHPRTALLRAADCSPAFSGPYVVKPRFGSWGRDVERCADERELRRCLRRLARRHWFRAHGAIVQEFLPSESVDLRIVLAAGQVVGAVERVAAAGEWRTNIALGGSRRAVEPPATACALARSAAEAFGADLVGVDLLPDRDGSYSVIELNGAVEFTDLYGDRIFARVAELLVPQRARRSVRQPQLRIPLATAPGALDATA